MKLVVQNRSPGGKSGNCYGMVLGQEADGRRLPFVCGHGGSMYLCPSCFARIVRGEPVDEVPNPRNELPGNHTHLCMPLKVTPDEIVIDVRELR